MGFHIKSRVLFVSIIVSSLSWSALGAEDVWKKVGFKVEDLKPVYSNQICYSKKANFVNCATIIQVLVQTEGKPSRFLPAEEVAAHASDYVSTIQDFKTVQIVGIKPIDKTVQKSIRVYFEESRKEQNSFNQAWEKLFAAQDKVDFDGVLNWVTSHSINADNESRMVAAAFNRVLMDSVDPHTRLEPSEVMNSELNPDEKPVFGIGAQIMAVGDQAVIQQPMEGGPALTAGVRAKDVITHVRNAQGVDEAVRGLPLDQVVEKIRGPEGVPVTVTFQRGNETLVLTIVRGRINMDNVTSKMITDGQHHYAYIKYNSFMPVNGCEEIAQAIVDLTAKGAEGLVLDLRGNGGGLLHLGVCVGTLFMTQGDTVLGVKPLDQPNAPITPYYTFNSNQMARMQVGGTMFFKNPKLVARLPITDLPMITLIDGHSASASEIVAGALQDYQRSLIVGDRSFGKATVQGGSAPPKLLRREVAEKITYMKTIQRFYQPSGRTNQIVGILPDFQVYSKPNPTEDEMFSIREENSYTNAVPAIGPAWVQPRPELITSIQGCLNQQGQAKAKYEAGQSDAILPDYQLLYSADVMTCYIENLGSKQKLLKLVSR